jgi:hypothetical protein
MTVDWNGFLDALGQDERSANVASLSCRIGETPVISTTPKEYNDPLGETKFYKFKWAGIELGFRQGKLNHVHLFIQSHEGYRAYTGPLQDEVGTNPTGSSIAQALGPPSASGEGKQNALLGYRHKWTKFDMQTVSIRFEFSQDDKLRKVSLISHAP